MPYIFFGFYERVCSIFIFLEFWPFLMMGSLERQLMWTLKLNRACFPGSIPNLYRHLFCRTSQDLFLVLHYQNFELLPISFQSFSCAMMVWLFLQFTIHRNNTAQKMKFSSVNLAKSVENLFTFTEEIFNGKLRFLFSIFLILSSKVFLWHKYLLNVNLICCLLILSFI